MVAAIESDKRLFNKTAAASEIIDAILEARSTHLADILTHLIPHADKLKREGKPRLLDAFFQGGKEVKEKDRDTDNNWRVSWLPYTDPDIIEVLMKMMTAAA